MFLIYVKFDNHTFYTFMKLLLFNTESKIIESLNTETPAILKHTGTFTMDMFLFSKPFVNILCKEKWTDRNEILLICLYVSHYIHNVLRANSSI